MDTSLSNNASASHDGAPRDFSDKLQTDPRIKRLLERISDGFYRYLQGKSQRHPALEDAQYRLDPAEAEPRLADLFNFIVRDIRDYTRYQLRHTRQLTRIGLALSAEKNLSRLFEMIVDEARELCNADAGTLYILDKDERKLRFEILQNASMNIRSGGTSGNPVKLADVPLYTGGKPNHSNVCTHVALTGEIINIEDVYEAEGFDFTGPRKYDKQSGYRSRSMLVIPMKNHENDIIGVVQLLNALDPDTGAQIPFYDSYVDAVGSLASQAAIALTNAQLIQELKDLFDAFIQSIATAIDEKSPYTGGHIRRVVELTMMIAERINETHTGAMKDLRFSEDEIEELRLATWMHDVGKITTPEYVVDKATKLHTIFDRIELLKTRFQLIASGLENERLTKKLALMEKGDASPKDLEALDAAYAEKIKTVDAEFAELEKYNIPGEFMSEGKLKRVEEISQKTYALNGDRHPYLTDDEKKNLCVKKGSLTDEERKIIQNHVVMTWKILYHLPFPKHLANVPDYAGAHHEKLNGAGYPLGVKGEDLAPQARIMAIADIFEALTAKDRPYKEPMKLSKAIQILGYMKKDGEIDPDIYELFVGSGLALQYASKEMNPTQIDIPEDAGFE